VVKKIEVFEGRFVIHYKRCPFCNSIHVFVYKVVKGYPYLKCRDCKRTAECVYK